MFSASGAFGSSQVNAASPSGDAKRAPRQEEKQVCLPVTVLALEAAVASRADEGGEILVHGVEPGMLVLVGVVESLTKSATSVEFSLNDSTGRIKVRLFITDAPPKDLDALESGRYVSISGNLRTTPLVHFAAIGVQLVRSSDEISYHMIESAHAALKLTRVRPDPATPAKQKAEAGLFGAESAAPMDLTPPKEDAPPSMTSALPGMAAAGQASVTLAAAPTVAPAEPVKAASGGPLKGDALRQEILAALEQGKEKEEGTDVAALIGRFSEASADEVKKMLEQLVTDGDAFTTIDDNHFTVF